MSNMGDISSVKPCRDAMKKNAHQTLLEIEQYFLGLELKDGGSVASAIGVQPIPDLLTKSERSASTASMASNTSSAGSSASLRRVPMQPASARVSFRLDKEQEDKPSRKTARGVVVDVNMNVKKAGEKKNMKMEIECPQYQPKRIYFNGKVMDVVE